MTVLNGTAISPGYADGRAELHRAAHVEPSPAPAADSAREVERLERALQEARNDLQSLIQRVHGEFGQEGAEIFSAHLALLEDPVLFEDISNRIKTDNRNAGRAVHESVAEFSARLGQAEDPYLREREQDVRDVGQRLLRQILGHTSGRRSRLHGNSILVAVELMPSDLLELDVQGLSGLVTEQGGETSHVAILARSLGIPAVTGISNATAVINSGEQLLVDGDTGTVICTPDARQWRQYRRQRKLFRDLSRVAREGQHLPCVTADGRNINILANLGRADEMDLVAAANVDGVGLLRTEFLFLDHAEPPTVAEQSAVYAQLAHQLAGRELVVRTLDLGGDKFPLFLRHNREFNPTLGVRGIRFSLNVATALFRDQIRAIIRAASRYPMAIMFPMVVGIDDLARAQQVVAEVAEEENVPSPPPTGVLVETPAAVLMIDEILERADFVSIGTNDLTQFILAADRNSLATIEDYSVIHPAVLRAIRTVLTAAGRHGKPATVCGEAAGTPEIACLLVGLGATRLSMSPAASAVVKYMLRGTSYHDLATVAEKALVSGCVTEIKALLEGLKPA